MLNSNTFRQSDLPYAPLPPAAYEAARAGILKCGFPEQGLLEKYSFSLSKDTVIRLNALSFAHPVHRNPGEYAAMTVFNVVNGHNDEAVVTMLARSAAPFHLVHRDDRFSFWASACRNEMVEPNLVKEDIAYDELDSVLSAYAQDLRPQRIIDVKQGRDTFTLFRDIHPLQLSFWAADVNRSLLVDHFAQAVHELRSSNIRMPDETAIDMAVQLLGAAILADTGVLGDEMRLRETVPLDRLIGAAAQRFHRYFRPGLFEKYGQAAKDAYGILRQIRYAGFMPDMLSAIYARAYGSEQRKVLGRFDTPLYLTRRIWKNIPVEYLPPHQRVTVDMTCGWGSFLIAGHERLSGLHDSKESSLREFLRGNDKDFSAAKLAGLGLLLSTSEDSWHTDHEDTLTSNWLSRQRANIIVGNPPFRGDRKKSQVGEKKRYEQANAFLELAIEWLAPNGYLAMLMPSSFTAAEASPGLRRQLLDECDVLELWEIPNGVFSEAEVQVVVVFAQKRDKFQGRSHNPVRVRTVQFETLENPKNVDVFTASGLVADQSVWNEEARKSKGSENTHIMDYWLTLPEYTWQAIASHCVDLRKRAEVIRGAIVGQKPEKKRWKDHAHPKQVPWLTGVKDVMPPSHPFFIDYTQATTITYPNDLEEPRTSDNPKRNKEYLLAGTKVLVPYNPNPSWGKRARVAIERKGHYVSDSFWVIAPTSLAQQKHITCEVLAAVLNWDVSNAWIIEHLKSPAIPIRAINTIPFPKDLSEEDCETLTQVVLQLEKAAYANEPEPEDARQTIDTILKAAYRLDNATFERLRLVKEWDKKPQITLDPQPDISKADCFISGVVDSVNAEQGTITLWMKDFDELQTVQIIPAMPGWMLRPEAAFRTKIPRRYIKQGMIDVNAADWGIFYPQPYTYMSDEELIEGFAALLYEDNRDTVTLHKG